MWKRKISLLKEKYLIIIDKMVVTEIENLNKKIDEEQKEIQRQNEIIEGQKNKIKEIIHLFYNRYF